MTFSTDALAEGFRVSNEFIAGGSSQVYRAVHMETGTDVALKLLLPASNPARLVRELRCIESLSHPGIVSCIASGVIGASPYLATQWVDGTRLSDLLRSSGERAADDSLALFEQLASALQAGHDQGVVHGDVTPTNILITENNRLVLIDYGIGRHENSATVTAHDQLAGTPRYLAPEVIRGSEPSPASDQYAAAVLLVEMLTGRWPFEDTDSVATVLHYQLNVSPTPLLERLPNLEPQIEQAVLTALDKNPEKRHASMNEFAHALRNRAPAEIVTKVLAANSHNSNRSAKAQYILGGISTLALSGALWWFATSPSVSDANSVQPSVSAIDCNLFPNPDFETAVTLKDNFFPDENDLGRITVIPGAGVNKSNGLRIGLENEYGLYGRMLPVLPGKAYNFAATINRIGMVHDHHMRVIWLDAKWQGIEGSEIVKPLGGVDDGIVILKSALAPDSARYAVATFYKDGSKGVLLVDDVVFSPATDTSCE